MCRPVRCNVCGKTTWAGCGEHVDQVKAQASVQAGGLEELLAPRAVEVGRVRAVADALAGDDVPDERVSVGVGAAGGEREHHIPGLHPVGAEHLLGLDGAGRRSRDVVVVDAQQARVLRGLAADEGRAGLLAPEGDAADDVGRPGRPAAAGG